MHTCNVSTLLSLSWMKLCHCVLHLNWHCVLCVRVEYFTVSLLRAYLWLHFNEVNREEKHRQQQHQQRTQLKHVTNKRILAIFRILYHFVYKEANRADKNRLIFVFFVAWTRSWRFWITGCYSEVLYYKYKLFVILSLPISLIIIWLKFTIFVCSFFLLRPSNYTLIRTRKLRSHSRQKRLCGQ